MKNFGIVKRLSAVMLIASLVFCMFNFTVACGNDDSQGYSFPTHSDPIKDGAYFITDAGYKEYKREHPDKNIDRSWFYVVVHNDKAYICIYDEYEYTIYPENGIYRGKAYGLGEGHYLDIALDGDMLYVRRPLYKSDHYQYKLDTSYTVAPECGYVLDPPQQYNLRFNTDQYSHPFIDFSINYKSSYFIGELQPAGEDDFTILKYSGLGIGHRYISFHSDELKVGKNMVKFYRKGRPTIDKEKKIFYTTQDSPSLLFEVYVNKNNTVTVTGENDGPYEYTFPTESDPLKDGVYSMTNASYEIYGREHPKYNGHQLCFYVAVHNDKAYISFYEQFGYTLYYENGIYHGKAYWKGDENDVDLALKGDMLYVKLYGSPSNNYEYKLDTSYTADPEYGYILRPPLYSSISFNTKYSYPYVEFEIDSTEPDFIAELQPAGEDAFTILKYSNKIIAKQVYFGPGELKVGKNTVKLYRKGRPTIDTSKKIFYTTQDSSILLYEVYVYENKTVTVTAIK